MKKIIVIVLLSCFFHMALAGGGLTHMYIARKSVDLLSDARLRHLIENNMDAYLVGAYYPDSGYVAGTHYGEESHWDPFIFAFADYINETYAEPVIQNPKLIAFLFGIAAHRVADEIMHATFYPKMGDHDFHGDGNKAHQYGDFGIDILVNVDKHQWFTEPKTWWVPVKDLTAIYHRMGHDDYTTEEIIRGNRVIAAAGIGERMIAAPLYPYMRYKMPWTYKHYEDDPVGLIFDEQSVATYQMRLWQRLLQKNSSPQPIEKIPNGLRTAETAIQRFAVSAINQQAVAFEETHIDGNVELSSPTIKNDNIFKRLLENCRASLER